MRLVNLPNLWCLAGVLLSFGGFGFRVDAGHEHGDFFGCEVNLRHSSLRCGVTEKEDHMEVFRRVKRYLTADEYRSLDKNNRMTPEGEVVPVHDEMGRELPDPVPVAPPVGWHKQPSMFDQIREMVRGEHVRMWAEAQGAETFEEAQDFDVEDEMFPTSEYEGEFEPMEDLQARRQAAFRERWLAERELGEYGQWKEREVREGRLPPDSPPTGAQAEPGKSGRRSKDRPAVELEDAAEE